LSLHLKLAKHVSRSCRCAARV